MSCVDIFPMHEGFWLELVFNPEGVFHIGDDVVDASVNGNWHLRDVLDWDEICVFLRVDQGAVVIRPDLESVLFHVLSVKHD